MPTDLTTTDEAIAELLRAVADAMERTAPPPPAVSGAALEQYLGDVVDITFSRADADRIALLARLMTLARAWNAEREPDRDLRPYAWLRRLERPLRRWERDRRLGTASPRPRPAELDARQAMFGAAQGPDPVIGLDTVAISVAELVAVHQLAGSLSLEAGMAARAAFGPLLDEAATLLRDGAREFGNGAFERPGATLAHVEQATWQVEQILQHPQGPEELPWLRRLWIEIAAALVFVHDAHEGRGDHDERWRAALDLAAEKLTVGELDADASGFDAAGTLSLVRSVALALAALWLDEERYGEDRDAPGAGMLEDRLLAAEAQALVAAWVVQRRMDDGDSPPARRG